MAPQQSQQQQQQSSFAFGKARFLVQGLGLLAGAAIVREAALAGGASGARRASTSGDVASDAMPAARRLAVPATVAHAFELVALRERDALAENALAHSTPKDPWKTGANFQAVGISMPLAPPIIKHDPAVGDGEGDKNIVGLQLLGKGERRCVVYGMGIAWESNFEQQMAREGCETHAFDCTVHPSSPVVAKKDFTFHNWCIGEGGSEFNKGNNYLRGRSADGLSFKTLSETMRLLGHDSVDVLKFDIEGFEWKLFDSELLSGRTVLPRQLAFELHTEGSKPIAVPPHLVQGKGFPEVNRLFLALHDKGYRVVSKEMNIYDDKCAEFVLVNVHEE